MAIRLRSTLKEWFKRGKYPLEEQFADWIDSFLHKTEDKLPLASVEDLPKQLNAKYDHASGVALEQKHQTLRTDFDQHTAASALQFERISDDIDELQAEDERLDGCITSETERATREETAIREEFAAADLAEKNRAVGEETAIREEFAAADAETLKSAKSYTDTKDTQVRNDFAAADALLREALEAETERATGEEAVIREEFAAADTEALTAAKDYTDTRETAIRSDMTSGDAQTLDSARKYADKKVADLVNSAPTTLDTLNELAEALGNDPNFAATVAGQIGGKADKTELPSAITEQDIESIFNQ